MYKISITKRGEKDLKNLERSVKNRVVTAISNLKDEPRPPGCRKIQSEEGVWRIRVGDWRIGYFIDDVTQEINIIRIAHRKEILRLIPTSPRTINFGNYHPSSSIILRRSILMSNKILAKKKFFTL